MSEPLEARLYRALRKGRKQDAARKPIKRKAPRRTKDPAIHDPKYLEWIRTLPCVACIGAMRLMRYIDNEYRPQAVQTSPTEAAHVGDHPAYRRAPDRTAIPLCGIEHHREGPASHHKLTAPGAFWKRHGIDRDALIAALNAEYDKEHP